MADNQLLEEFATAHPGTLQRVLTDTFDHLLAQPSLDVAAEAIRAKLEELMQEKITQMNQGDQDVPTEAN